MGQGEEEGKGKGKKANKGKERSTRSGSEGEGLEKVTRRKAAVEVDDSQGIQGIAGIGQR